MKNGRGCEELRLPQIERLKPCAEWQLLEFLGDNPFAMSMAVPPTSSASAANAATLPVDQNSPDSSDASSASTPPATSKGFWERLYPGPLIRAGAALLGGWLLSLGHHRTGTAVASAALGAIVFGTLAHVGLRIHKEDGFRSANRAVPATYAALRDLVPESIREQARTLYGTARESMKDWTPPKYVGGSYEEVYPFLNETKVVRLGVGESRIIEGALTDVQDTRFVAKDQGRFEMKDTPDGRVLDVHWSKTVDEGSQHWAEMSFIVQRQAPDGSTVKKLELLRFSVRRPQIGPLGAHLDLNLAKESAVRRVQGMIERLNASPAPTDAAGLESRNQAIATAHAWLKEDLAVAVASLDPEHPRLKAMGLLLTNLNRPASATPEDILKHLTDVTTRQIPRLSVRSPHHPSAADRGSARAAAEKVLQETQAFQTGGHDGATGKQKDRAEGYAAARREFLKHMADGQSQPFARIAAELLKMDDKPESLWTLQPLINAAEVRAAVSETTANATTATV